MNATTAKYLAQYATADIAVADGLTANYDVVVVVPLYDEDARFVDGVGRAARGRRVLLVAVVNAGEESPAAAVQANAALVAELATLGPKRELAAPHPSALIEVRPGLDLLVVDRNSPGHRFPSGEGVGLARRIGCDIALAAHASGRVASPWLHTTDGDASLPDHYFDAAAKVGSAAALTYPYVHDARGDDDTSRAYRLYELSLRYYVAGLRHAGSPYAYWSIGSTIAIDADVYAAVRGFPRREAAEDFYLLNKARKHGDVVVPDCGPIRLRPRPGVRVPFGTNAAVVRLAPSLARGGPFTLYDPRSFPWLGQFVQAVKSAAAERSSAPVDELAASGPPILSRAIERLGASDAIRDAAARCSSAAALERRLLGWFDAFRTLKLVHHMRAEGLVQVEWREALAAAPFIETAGVRDGQGEIAMWSEATRRAELTPVTQ